MSETMLEIAALVQILTAVLIVSVIVHGFPMWFGDPLVHPDDNDMPYKMQRIQISDTGEDLKDFIPRRYVRASLFYPAAAILVWLWFYYHFGLLLSKID
ncbi:MAG TPA: hypothetical protein VHL34_23200 [Rhizomicrobium sp.]|nr:hypothetical protein [Rhizomicrobium sp.]